MTFKTGALPDLYINLSVKMRPFLSFRSVLNAPDNFPQISLPSTCSKVFPSAMNKKEKDPDFSEKLLKQKKCRGQGVGGKFQILKIAIRGGTSLCLSFCSDPGETIQDSP